MQTLITSSICKAAQFLKEGQIIAFPTETVFGLGACINQEEALKKIFIAKKRPIDNPLIVHIASLNQLTSLTTDINSKAQLLIEKFWPGPLTLILECQEYVSPLISAGLPTIAIRQPKHSLALKLIKEVNMPIAAPSANLSGRPSATKIQHVLEDFEGFIPCILKGQTEYGLESTVIDCTTEEINVLRLGSLGIEALKQVIPDLTINNKNQVASPGTRYKHYAPQAKVMLIDSEKQINQINQSAYIGFRPTVKPLFKVKLINSSEEYARNLFSFFRECDQEGIQIIYCEKPPKDASLGLALQDRLQKAAMA